MLTAGLIFLLTLLVIYGIYRWSARYQNKATAWRKKQTPDVLPDKFHCHPPKPEWVKKEVIRLKAFMPKAGYRTIAHTFNRLYASRKQMTVGKTFVAYTIQKHRYKIQVLRRKLKHKRPHSLPRHRVWGCDLTYIKDATGHQHPVFGLVEHQTRACLSLQTLKTKTSITLLRTLLDTIEALQEVKPQFLRTDNERIFTSVLFRVGLWLLGIRPQRTEICCPWQNGRIERLFGTLKTMTKELLTPGADILQQELALFRFWYNHIRPHQNLDGLTPAEIWQGRTHYPGRGRKAYWFEEWDGVICGYYFPS